MMRSSNSTSSTSEGSSSALEAEYATAYSLYEAGDYGKAASLFQRLVLLEPADERYWRGLAASQQLSGECDAALYTWAICALFAERDPIPHFHAAECLLQKGEQEEAKVALHTAEKLANPFHPLLETICYLRNSLCQ